MKKGFLYKCILSVLLPAVLMTAFSLCTKAEPQEGFVQEGDLSPDMTTGSGPAGAAVPGPSPGGTGPSAEAGGTLGADDTSVSFLMDTGTGPGPAEEEAAGGVSLSFSYGFRNIVKSTRRLPFEVELRNHEDSDLSGRLEISLPGSVETGRDRSEAAEIRYVYDAFVPAGETVTIQDIISAGENGGTVRIRLYDGSGGLLREQQETVNIQSIGPELLIGVLSDDPEKLGYFRGISVAGTALRTRIVELDPQDLPDTPAGLSQIDVIVISDLDSRKLPEDGINTIREWVSDGGALLVGTGARPSTAVQLLGNIRGFTLYDAVERDIDMGMKYSKTGPDGAVIRLLVRDVNAASGTQVMQSGDTVILTTIPRGNGVVGVTAYDLCDISDFCREEIGYVDDLLQGLLGTVRIGRLAGEEEGSGFYASVRPLVGLTDPDRLPSAALYVMFALGYLGLIGFGLYGYLRTRGLGIYYHAFVPIAACGGALVIAVMSLGLKSGDPSADYAMVREISGTDITEEGFVRLMSSSGDDFSLRVSDNTVVIPVVREAEDESLLSGSAGAKQEPHSVLEIRDKEESCGIRTYQMKPFSASLLEYRGSGRTEGSGLETKITVFDESLDGIIRNGTGTRLEDVYLLMYGRLAKIGTLEDGEEISLDEAGLLSTPSGSSGLIAEYMTGIRDLTPGTGDHIRALRRARLLSWYIENNLQSYYEGVRLIAFTDDGTCPVLHGDGSAVPGSGTTLCIGFTDAEFNRGNTIWRTSLSTEPKLISGEYDAAANTTRGSVVLEYSLGNDISVRSLTFCELSEVFSGEKLVPFAGTIAVYNYQSGSYDPIRRDKMRFSASEISPYLSPDNTMTVRYVPDEGAAAAVPMYLPVPDVTGVGR